jgi:hypothetical protein
MQTPNEFYFKSYMEWRTALTVRCGIKLTAAYARERIEALQNGKDPATEAFLTKYGEAYHRQVIAWFEQAERES